MVDNNFNGIFTESSGDWLNDSCEFDRIEGNNSKIFEQRVVPLFEKLMEIHVLCILSK